MCKAIEGQI